jgi:hypothetical protein
MPLGQMRRKNQSIGPKSGIHFWDPSDALAAQT